MSVSSLLYLHKKTLSSKEIKKDVDFLLGLLFQEGSKRKRWQAYLDKDDMFFEDCDVHSHVTLLENLAYREVMVEGLDEEKALLMMWAARFHKLGELQDGDVLFNLKTKEDKKKKAEYVRKNIHSQLQSDYAKNMLEKVLAVSLDGKKMSDSEFDDVEFFDSLKCRGHINIALKMIEQKPISKWDILVANVLFNQLSPLVAYGKKYRSVRVYLQKNAKKISDSLESYLTFEKLSQSFERIYGEDDFEEKKKFLDVAPGKLIEIKNVWSVFVKEN